MESENTAEKAHEMISKSRYGNSAEFYDKWASNYDKDVDAINYSGYKSILSKWQEYYPGVLEDFEKTKLKHKMLDAGCGTGLVGEFFSKTSIFRAIEMYGDDFSSKMLAEAKIKDVYVDLKEVNLKQELPYESESFDSIVTAGVFGIGRIVPEDLPNIVRVLKPKGYLFGTINKQYYGVDETWNWKEWIVKSGCDLVEDNEMPYRDGAVALVLVIRKL